MERTGILCQEFSRAVGIEWRCRYARRQHRVHVYRRVGRKPEVFLEPVRTRHVYHFVRVGDDEGRSVRQYGFAESGRQNHTRLYVHVRVGKPRRHYESRAIVGNVGGKTLPPPPANFPYIKHT